MAVFIYYCWTMLVLNMQLNLDLMAINHLDLFVKYVSLTCMDWYRTGIVGLSFL